MGNSRFFFFQSFLRYKKVLHILSTLTIHHASCRSCEAVIECSFFYLLFGKTDRYTNEKKTPEAKTTNTKFSLHAWQNSDEWGRKSAFLFEMLIGTCQSCWQSSNSRQDFGGRACTVKNLTPFVMCCQRNCCYLVRWPNISFTCSLLGFPGNITLHMSITSLKGRCERDDYHAANVHQKWGNTIDSTVVRFQDSLDTLIPYQAVTDDTSHSRRQGKSQFSRTYNIPMDDASTLQLYRFCTYAK